MLSLVVSSCAPVSRLPPPSREKTRSSIEKLAISSLAVMVIVATVPLMGSGETAVIAMVGPTVSVSHASEASSVRALPAMSVICAPSAVSVSTKVPWPLVMEAVLPRVKFWLLPVVSVWLSVSSSSPPSILSERSVRSKPATCSPKLMVMELTFLLRGSGEMLTMSAVGPVVSTVIVRLADSEDSLPATSKATAVMTCSPSLSAPMSACDQLPS